MRTFVAKEHDIDRKWYIVDAKGKRLGRLCTQIADTLRGKNKAIFTPHVDCGDFVIVINAKHIVVTGRKAEQKSYRSFSGYPGGLKEVSYESMLNKQPEQIIKSAVKGMLTKGALGRSVIKKLKIYEADEHPHGAQQPIQLNLK